MNTIPTALAFDLGASSGRALIGKLIESNGEKRLELEEIHRFTNEAISVGNHQYWDILMIFKEIKIGIKKAFLFGYKPKSIAIDTWGADFGLIDRNGELLGNPYYYRDPQTQGLVKEISELIGEDRLFKQSGLQFMPFNTLYQLYAMKKANSPKLESAENILLTPDLLNYFLTGIKSCEYTMATTTQLINPMTGEWNKSLMNYLGISDSLFNDYMHPGSRIGVLSKNICKELGVPSVDVIAVGSHDTASAVATIGMNAKEFAYIVCGTWSLLGTQLRDPMLTSDVRRLQFSNEGGVGQTNQLLKNIMGLWLLQQCKRKWEGNGEKLSFTRLVELASEAEPFRSLIDPDDSRFMNPSDMEEEITAFCIDTGQSPPRNKGETIRCIMESLAFRYRKVLEQIEQLTGNTYSKLHMVGGGVKNEWLCQFSSNAIGRPVLAGPIESSAIGNLLVQFTANGDITNTKEGEKIITRSFPKQVYEPKEKGIWEQHFNRFNHISTSI